MMLVLALALFSSSITFAQENDCATLEQCQKSVDANPNSSMAHYRMGLILFMNGQWGHASLEFLKAEHGDLEPEWTEVWSHVYAGKAYDLTDQRERAINEYKFVLRISDVWRDSKVLREAKKEAAEYIKSPYRRP